MREWHTAEPGDFLAPLPDAADGHGPSNGRSAAPMMPLATVAAASFAEADIPERSWLVKDMIPDRAVTILAGDGGVGKSLLAKQLGVAVAAAVDWIGTLPEFGPVIYVSCEDDNDEVHRRLADIAAAQGVDLADLAEFHIVSLAGRDAVLGAPNRAGIIMPTPLWQSLAATVAQIAPRLIILDNLADVFAGNENSRPEARQFVGLLRGLAIEHRLAVLLIAHPSLSGLASGTGTSGSTAWSNSVRSRLYLDRARADDGEGPDPDLRVLRSMKANYAPLGDEIRLRWDRGRFRPDTSTTGFEKMAAEARADRAFLELVGKFQTDGRDVSPSPSANYAPKLFSEHPDGRTFSKKALEAAMNRMFAAKKVKMETFGPPSRQRRRIIIATDGESFE